MAARIAKLDESVVNRIAAGEVVQRPVNAVKEMIENSIDAKATNITINVVEGGLKLLQIQDDGTGIVKEDLDILCERFATSKLQKFEDLTTMETYGFRGEALASISHVAHVTVVTKTAEAICAYKVQYSDGKPTTAPKPSAGNVGTLISVENLFYNVPTRRKVLKNASEEFANIVDVVGRYAVHNASVGFMLKKNGTTTEVRTPCASSTLENIRIIFGSALAKELVSVECEISNLHFKCSGYVSNANYSMKKGHYVLFINHRLVDSVGLRKSIDSVYKAYLPSGMHPFVYLSLGILPKHVDVNVHPTKHEVHFLHEDAIIEHIQRALEEKLLDGNSSRTLYTQALLPRASLAVDENVESRSCEKVTDPKRMVRTDDKEQKIESFLSRKSLPNVEFVSDTSKEFQEQDGDENAAITPMITPSNHQNGANKRSVRNGQNTFTNIPRYRDIKLASIKTLKQKFIDRCHTNLGTLFKEHTFVGVINEQYAVVQHQTKLFLIDTVQVSEELFYQILIHDFGNIGFLKFKSPLPLYDLLMMALDNPLSNWEEVNGSKESLSEFAVKFLKSKAEMLEDYFSVKIDKDGNLCSIPYLLDDYMPALEGLSTYVFRLSAEVDWDEEEQCFHQFCRETAKFYSKINAISNDDVKPSLPADQVTTESQNADWKWTIEHVLYPTMKHSLYPPKEFLDNGCILEIVNLPNLYKVFERC